MAKGIRLCVHRRRDEAAAGANRPVLRRPESGDYACFLDLVELRLVRQLLAAGFTLQKLRPAFIEAEQLTGESFPFARQPILIGGGKLFLRPFATGDKGA